MSVADNNTTGLNEQVVHEQETIKQTRSYGKSNSIAEILSRDGRFSKLLKIFSSSNGSLQNDLADPRNQVTIFAPTDKAFEEFNQRRNASHEELEKILDYHIISDIIDEEDVYKSDALVTNYIAPELLNEPQRILIERKTGGLYLNYGTEISEANIEARNGIIHIIDQVLELPKSIPEQLGEFSQFSIFLKALEKSGLEKEFNEPGLTVFAPSNFAFKSLGPAAVDYLLSTEGREDLRYILRNHISPELIYAGDLKLPVDGRDARANKAESRGESFSDDNDDEYLTRPRAQIQGRGIDTYRVKYPSWIRGEEIRLYVVTDYRNNIDVTVNGQARIVLADGVAKNGVIHVIDRVLLPVDVQLPKLQWHELNE
ncbi:beta-Ig-H3/fasciclin [Basidiobolus meristosporus CBS 931.73]|uniref:Beta-Ig-H3/fasciclin n=1 Tax=Basidiobolus meristosporus CBS 931.73 TaxID=1314790 RepID=A0A1Y1YTN1_9FUNG|nr:beta-Ig-H3/fasciclin [Basidiobolus meristosporus CBS 931.73]|eukprot:ORY01403.1 beta-Ig-H3/fasciclin [Basidiobolus meristosporus CBS 931.73]